MTTVRRIACIGGGGFSEDDPSLHQERWLLSLVHGRAGGGRPSVLFVGTASGDRELHQLRFLRAFAPLDCRPSCLAFFPYDMRRDYRAAVVEADLVFVGGGNTPAMLAVWRSFGFDAALREALDGGTVLAGISAGANCWFERYVTDSVPGGGVRDGLGWLPGTFCPHLDSEVWRRPVLEAQASPWIGAGERVAVLFEDGRPVEAVHHGDGVPLLHRSDAATGPALPLRRLDPPSP